MSSHSLLARKPATRATEEAGRSGGRLQGQGGGDRRERAKELAASGAKAAAGVAAAWLAVRLTVEGLQRARRSFLRQLLLDLTQALEDVGQEYWVDFGGLLGIHRGGDLLPRDNDVDLAVLNPDWPALLEALRAVLPAKYSLKVVTPKEKPESSWIRVYCPLGMADLFGGYLAESSSDDSEGGAEIFVDCGHGDTMHIDRSLVLPPGRKQWRGHSLKVPANVEGTLERRYGSDWRVDKYMAKGADTVEGSKLHARIFRALAKIGIKI